MMKFIYDSLDTVKHIKHPTQKEYIQLIIAIFGLVIFAGLYFVFADSIFSGIYKRLYTILG